MHRRDRSGGLRLLREFTLALADGLHGLAHLGGAGLAALGRRTDAALLRNRVDTQGDVLGPLLLIEGSRTAFGFHGLIEAVEACHQSFEAFGARTVSLILRHPAVLPRRKLFGRAGNRREVLRDDGGDPRLQGNAGAARDIAGGFDHLRIETIEVRGRVAVHRRPVVIGEQRGARPVRIRGACPRRCNLWGAWR